MFSINKIVERRKLMRQMKSEEQASTSKSASSTPRPRVTVELALPLSDIQRRALRITWVRLSGGSTGGGGRAAVRLMEAALEAAARVEPQMKHVFVKTAFASRAPVAEPGDNMRTLNGHAKFLARFVGAVVAGLDSHTVDAAYSPSDFGGRHVSLVEMGFSARFWESLGETLSDVLFAQDAVRAYPHASKAWAILIAHLTDMLRADFDKCRRQTADVR